MYDCDVDGLTFIMKVGSCGPNFTGTISMARFTYLLLLQCIQLKNVTF